MYDISIKKNSMSIRERVEDLHNLNKELSHYDFYILYLLKFWELSKVEKKVITKVMRNNPMQKTICRTRSNIIQQNWDCTLSDQLRLFELL